MSVATGEAVDQGDLRDVISNVEFLGVLETYWDD